MTIQRIVLVSIILAAFGGSYAVQRWMSGSDSDSPAQPANARPTALRVVSLAPSTTEVLFALDLGDQVVGVTRYCDYPPAAFKKARVGGYYDPNYERIAQLQPDVIVTLPEHEDLREQLRKMGLQTLTVDHSSVAGILDSIDIIGNACGATEQAEALRSDLQSRVDRIREQAASRERPRVLVSLGRDVQTGSAGRIAVCGPGSIYDELVELAGGTNAYNDNVPYPRLSGEGILAINPDVIVDLVSDMEGQKRGAEEILRDWEELPGLAAVENNRVHVLGGDHLTVPGPRFILLLEDLARIIHPHLQWNGKKASEKETSWTKTLSQLSESEERG